MLGLTRYRVPFDDLAALTDGTAITRWFAVLAPSWLGPPDPRRAAAHVSEDGKGPNGETTAARRPSPTPNEPCGEGYWPFDTTPARHGQEGWEELFLEDTFGKRDYWRRNVEGPPPWTQGPSVAVADDLDDEPDDDLAA